MHTQLAITWRRGDESRDVALTLHRPSASLADVLAALHDAHGRPHDPPTSVTVDGVALPGDVPAATVLRRGAVLASGAPPDRTWSASDGSEALAEALVEVRAVNGLAAGDAWRLPAGDHDIGRGAVAVALGQPTVSRRHARLTVAEGGAVTVTDLGSANGSAVAGRPLIAHRPVPWPAGATAHVGATELRLGAAPAVPHAVPTGPVHRPPRRREPRPVPEVRRPRPVSPPAPPPRFSWAGALVPLALGLALAAAIDPRLAWFGLTGPVMVTATWLEERRRTRKSQRTADAEAGSDRARHAADLEAACADDARWLRRVRPDVDALVRRALTGAAELWERRPDHDDAWVLRVGEGPVRWDAEGSAERWLVGAPVSVALGPDRVLGLVGAPDAARALARSLVVQAAVLHGPADGPLLALTRRPGDWPELGWLPHAVGPDGRRLRFDDVAERGDDEVPRPRPVAAPDASAGLGTFGPAPAGGGAARPLVVVDGGPARPLPPGWAAIVLARSADELPASCTAVVEVGADGVARLIEPATGRTLDDVTVTGVSRATALAVSRALASRVDPELAAGAGALPADVDLADVLGLDTASTTEVRARWAANPGGRPSASIGATTEGPLVVDLERDGPHALVAGTTGAGKSELLRTLVTALALGAPPTHLAFVLVDFKGGSAFDVCARLPHVAGVVTDLDDHLAARALRSLEAELRERERRLRSAGVADLATLHRTTDTTDLPRLVVVVDEFATLAAELPTFVDSLVDIAQRGRSLGVHLVLATQRPSGVVSPTIRANTDLRMALRVQDRADSTEVIDVGDAARLPRSCPGRAVVRRGPGERTTVQIARATTPWRPADAVSVAPWGAGPVRGVTAPADGTADGPSVLDVLVEAIVDAARELGLAPVRRPWTDPLPGRVEWRADEPALGWLDDPDHQTRRPLRWDPTTGHLGIFGTVGAGAGPALHTVAATLAATHPVAQLHLYGIDHGGGGLGELIPLAHVGAVVRAGERERLERLVARLVDEVARRRATGADAGPDEPPGIVVLIDDLPALLASVADLRSAALADAIRRLLADGPAVGVAVAFTASGPHALPLAILGGVAHRWVLRLADPAEALALGLRGSDRSSWPAGRGEDAVTGLELQLATVAPADLAELGRVGAGVPGPHRPAPIGVLPDLVPLGTLAGLARVDAAELVVPIGVGGATLAPAGWRLRPGEHALVTGPVRSGRTTALRAIARVLAELGHRADGSPVVERIAMCGRPSALAADPAVTRVVAPGDLAAIVEHLTPAEPVGTGAWAVVLVDDADLVDDPTGGLLGLLRSGPPGVHVIAATPADRVLGEYGHWTRELRRSRVGLALRPLVERDGEVWHTTLPRHPGPFGPGRGVLVHPDGSELVQVATLARDAVAPTLRRSA